MHENPSPDLPPATALPRPALRTLLVAFDETNQDPATLAAAAEIAIRSDTPKLAAFTAFAYKGEREPRREEYLDVQTAALEQTAGIPATRLPEEDAPTDPHREPYEQILDWRIDKSADLIVVPAPYLEDFWKLGRDSAGANLDVLMARSPKPLLIIRQPPGKGDPALPADVLFPILPRCSAVTHAASWALHLVRPKATLQLLIVLPDGLRSQALDPLIGHDIAPTKLDQNTLDALAEFAGSEFPGFLAALSEGAAKKSASAILSIRSGEFVRSALSVASGTEFPKVRPISAPVHRVISVFGCHSDPASETHQLCAALVRNLPGPALITTVS